MTRPRLLLPGVVLIAGALACQGEPVAETSTPRVIFQSRASTISPAISPAGSTTPLGQASEVVVLGELSSLEAATPRSTRRAEPGPDVIYHTVYIEAPAEEVPGSVDAAPDEAYPHEAPPPDGTVVARPAGGDRTGRVPTAIPTTFPAPDEGPNRTEDALLGAAIGAGIGAVLGGRDGAIRGGLGGGIGGAIGGRSGAILGGVLGGSSADGGILGGRERGRRPPRRDGGCFTPVHLVSF